MAQQLDQLLNGRALPTKIRHKIDELIAAKDERIMRVLEGNPQLEDIFTPAVNDLLVQFDRCFEGCPLYKAKQISSQERASVASVNKNVASINLTYGEVKFESLSKAICLHVDMKDKKVFYDIGSGSGRGVFTGALIHDFDKVAGVEIVPGLHKAAETQLELYEATIKPGLEEEHKAAGRNYGEMQISLLCDDFRNMDWSDADLCWANSTCFGSQLMKALSTYSEKMKKGSYFVTLTQKITSPHWELVAPGQLYPMSWGSATIYVWKKVLDACVGEPEPEPATVSPVVASPAKTAATNEADEKDAEQAE